MVSAGGGVLGDNHMMTLDVASPSGAWLVTVGQTRDEEWLVVKRWNIADETHNKSVMVACGGGDPRGLVLKNAQLVVLMSDREVTAARIIVSDVENGNVMKTVKLDTTGPLTSDYELGGVVLALAEALLLDVSITCILSITY